MHCANTKVENGSRQHTTGSPIITSPWVEFRVELEPYEWIHMIFLPDVCLGPETNPLILGMIRITIINFGGGLQYLTGSLSGF